MTARTAVVAALLAACAAGACQSSGKTPAPRPALEAAAPTDPGAMGPAPIEAPELERFLRARGVRGVIAVLEGDARVARCSDVALCRREFVPASTFKIANSIIGLETGVIDGAEFVIPWDGVERSIASWNRDHSLRTAIADSVVPYYQELARRVGRDAMQVWLTRLRYGNGAIGDAVDRFWLDGPLAISPLAQLDFLRRLARDRLPIAERTRAIVLDILVRGEVAGRTLRGKTGWAAPNTDRELGWFVGWIDGPGQPRFVSVTVLDTDEGVDMATVRQAIAEDVLRAALDAAAAATEPVPG